MHPTFTLRVTLISLLASLATNTSAQSNVFRVSPVHDSTDGPTNYPFPGFFGGFRQQILISAGRLSGLQGQKIKGLWVRRDLDKTDALQGGAVDLEIRVSPATRTPDRANRQFAVNVPTSGTLVFQGRIAVPSSPALGASATPWSVTNSVKVLFQSAFDYRGGNLCIDVNARPVKGAEPQFWFIDYEMSQTYDGGSIVLGRSCSKYASIAGRTLYADDSLLQIGSTMRISARGRPGSVPIFLLGASSIPGGRDLKPLNAPNCFQHVSFFLLTRLAYTASALAGRPSFLRFHAQIPFDTNLLGMSVFTQVADDETGLPRAEWSNAAGLTTSNGLQLKISSQRPDLGMSVVTSDPVDAMTPMPTSGKVDVGMAPILRLLY